MASCLEKGTGVPHRYEDPGMLGFVMHRVRQGDPLAYVGVTAAIYGTARAGLAGELTGDVERLLGRPPRTLEDFA